MAGIDAKSSRRSLEYLGCFASQSGAHISERKLHLTNTPNTVKITSSLPIASVLSSPPPHISKVSADQASLGALNSERHNPSPASPNTLHHAASRLLAAASNDGPKAEAGPSKSGQPPRMRSSIACARCRRSKVKCVNNGIGTTCRACETTGRECTYPVPIPGGGGGGGVRRESGESRQPGESVMQHEVCLRSSNVYHGA